jgi:hypothetical protein
MAASCDLCGDRLGQEWNSRITISASLARTPMINKADDFLAVESVHR